MGHQGFSLRNTRTAPKPTKISAVIDANGESGVYVGFFVIVTSVAGSDTATVVDGGVNSTVVITGTVVGGSVAGVVLKRMEAPVGVGDPVIM